jgi:two-component system, sensor histidine kinase and response regulator
VNKTIVLVVDDEQRNLRLMDAVLTAAGYQVQTAGNGEDALRMALENAPDVILLDIMMPVLDGIETCSRLKANPATAHIPVLLVTTLSDRSDRIKGIDSGANDFITKPIDKEDLVLRVRNAAYTNSLHTQLQQNFDRLKELETLKDNLIHMIVHDLRSPLAGINGYIEIARMRTKEANDLKTGDFLAKATGSLNAMMELINSLLDINRMEEGKMPMQVQHCVIPTLFNEALKTVGAAKDKCCIAFVNGDDLPAVSCDPDLIRRVFANLLANSLKFTPEKGDIRISAVAEGSMIRVSISDTGPGIPLEYHTKIFEKFGQVEIRQQGKVYSTGLGLTFCKLAVEAHGGKIGVISAPEKGSAFWFTLPLDR